MTAETSTKSHGNPRKEKVQKSVEPDKVAIVSGWFGINPDVLDNPDLSVAKALIQMYAKRLASNEDAEQLKTEAIAMFDNPVGQYTIAMATNTAENATEIAKRVGDASGNQLRVDMKAAFNNAFREALLTPDPNEIPQAEKNKITQLQVANMLNALRNPTPEPPKQIPTQNPQ